MILLGRKFSIIQIQILTKEFVYNSVFRHLTSGISQDKQKKISHRDTVFFKMLYTLLSKGLLSGHQ